MHCYPASLKKHVLLKFYTWPCNWLCDKCKAETFSVSMASRGGDHRQKKFRVLVAIDTERNDTERPVHTSPCERDADRKSLNNSRRMNK